MSNKARDFATQTKTLSNRMVFANFVQRRELIEQGRLLGGLNPNNIPSYGIIVQEGAVNTTPAELAAYIAAVTPAPPPAPPTGPTLRSKDNDTSGGFPIGGTVTKDMGDEDYTQEFDPNIYQSEFFPGMADFVDGNIVQGDKDSGDRLNASYWNDLGNDVFDDWGYFYIYDVESGKYYFPLINPQNQDDGIFTTQSFEAFGRTFTIRHGWAVEGIFKFDISVADDKPFRFGAYGNMGSDGDENIEDLTHAYTASGTNLTLYYQRHAEDGDSNEILYSYWIPKAVSANAAQTYDFYNNSDDNSMMSKEVTGGVIVYFAKKNDVKEWVAADLEIAA